MYFLLRFVMHGSTVYIAHNIKDPTTTICYHMPQITYNSVHRNLINIAHIVATGQAQLTRSVLVMRRRIIFIYAISCWCLALDYSTSINGRTEYYTSKNVYTKTSTAVTN